MPSYVARPNKSISADFSWSIEILSSSSPQMESCQPRSQLFAPSKKPSRETTFHMMTFLISPHPPWLAGKRRAYFIFFTMAMCFELSDRKPFCPVFEFRPVQGETGKGARPKVLAEIRELLIRGGPVDDKGLSNA